MWQTIIMKISFDPKRSNTLKILTWLFVDNDKNLFKDSKLLRYISRLDNSRVSIAFLGLSLTCLWYDPLLVSLGMDWIGKINLGAIFLLLALVFCDKKKLRSTKAIIYLALFILALLVSGLWAAINGLEMGMIFIGIMLLSQFALAFIIASTYKLKTIIINMILLLSLPVLIVGCLQVIGGELTSKLWVSGVESLVSTRAFGFFGSPNVLGSLSMITSVVVLFAFLDKRRWYYLGYEIIALLALILTYSRSAWLGLGIGVGVVLIIKNWKLVALLPFGFLLLLVPSVRQRLLVAASQEYMVDAAIDGRIWSFNNAMEIFRTSPLLGTGPGTYGGQTAIYYNSPIYLRGLQNGYVALPYTDNQWLEIFVQVGLLGTILIGGFFISHFVNNLKQFLRSGSHLSLGVLAAIIAILIDGAFGNIWEFGSIAVLAGIYLGLGNNYEK